MNTKNKDAYYFSHDSNARNDEKILALRMKHGMEGYGIFWGILERMRENTDYMCAKDYALLAFEFRCETEKIKSVVEDFDLFQFTEDTLKFYSASFLRRMERKDEKSAKAQKAAEARWNKSNKNADAMQTHSESNAIKGKERKGKEKKVNQIKREESKKEDSFHSLKDLFELIEKEKEWKANLAQNFNEVDPSFSEETVNNYLEQFFKKLSNDDDKKKTLPDFKKHFSSWLKIEMEKKISQKSDNKGISDEYRRDIARRLNLIPKDQQYSEEWLRKKAEILTGTEDPFSEQQNN